MHSSGLSADGALSAVVGAVAFVVFTLNLIHHLRHLKERHPEHPSIGRFIDVSERLRAWTLRSIVALYRGRYVALFVLAAMFVSTISPVSSLMEVESSVLRNACDNLTDTRSLLPGIDRTECRALASAGSTTFFERSLKATKEHFLQVALWPLMAVVWGFGLALFIRVMRTDSRQPLEEVIEEFPHVHHFLTVVFGGLAFMVGHIQNMIGG